MKERRKKAAMVMREVWIGKRLWSKDWERRIWLYNILVWMVMGYGTEIWGWKQRKEIEEINERYLRWIMGINRKTLGYMIKEELKR